MESEQAPTVVTLFPEQCHLVRCGITITEYSGSPYLWWNRGNISYSEGNDKSMELHECAKYERGNECAKQRDRGNVCITILDQGRNSNLILGKAVKGQSEGLYTCYEYEAETKKFRKHKTFNVTVVENTTSPTRKSKRVV